MLTCLALGGCVSTGTQCGSLGKYRMSEQLKNINDEEALRIYCEIYNVPVKTKADEVARNIALGEFMKTVKRRSTRRIKESGVYDIEYEEVRLNKWSDTELASLYKHLEKESGDFSIEPDYVLSESEKGLKVVRATAMYVVFKEAKRRDSLKRGMELAAKALSVALTVALSII